MYLFIIYIVVHLASLYVCVCCFLTASFLVPHGSTFCSFTAWIGRQDMSASASLIVFVDKDLDESLAEMLVNLGVSKNRDTPKWMV